MPREYETNILELAVRDGGAVASLSMADSDASVRLIQNKKQNVTRNDFFAKATFFSYGAVVFVTVLAVGLHQSLIVFFSQMVSLFTSSWSAFQRIELMKTEHLKDDHTKLELKARRIRQTHADLTSRVDELWTQAQNVERLEIEMNAIVSTQGATVKSFTALAQINRKILKQLMSTIKADMVHQILKAVIQSDRNSNFEIDNNEIEALIFRLKNLSGVKFNEGKFRSLFEKHGHQASSLLFVCGELLEEKPGAKPEDMLVYVDPKEFILSKV